MNKKEVLKKYHRFIKHYHISPGDFVLVAGTACVFHGVRETTSDVDVQVTSAIYDKLKHLGEIVPSTIQGAGRGDRLVIDDFDIMVSDYECEVIDGVGVQTLGALKTMKESLFLALHREKDRKDIEIIKSMLARSI